MEYQDIFNVAATTIILLLFVIWEKSSILNAVIKIILFLLTLGGAFVTLESFGYIVEVSQ